MITLPLSLLVVHFLGDFVAQSDWMAKNKSRSLEALYFHVLVYSMCFVPWGFKFWMWTFITHFLTDFVTSRITAKLWFFQPVNLFYNAGGERYQLFITLGGSRHWFFVVIGLDQLIHYVTLALTLRWAL